MSTTDKWFRPAPRGLATGLPLFLACSNGGERARIVDAGVDGTNPIEASADVSREAGADDATSSDGGGDDAGSWEAGATCSGPCDGVCENGGCLVTLAQASAPIDIAVDGTNAYFTSCSNGDSGAALSVPIDGGAVVTLAAGEHCPTSLAVAGSSLFVAGLHGGDITMVPTGGGAAITLASSDDPPIGLAADETGVYWTTAGGAVMKVSVDGGSPAVLASGEGALTRPVVSEGFVYWGDTIAGGIKRLGLDGGAPAVVVAEDPVAALSIAGGFVYFASGYLLWRTPLAGGTIVGVGTPTGGQITPVAADTANAYFASDNGIYRAPEDGGPSTILATDQGEPAAIVLDGTSLYWVNAIAWAPQLVGGPGQVMKLTPR